MLKKDWTGWLLLVGALVVGVLAFWLVRGYLASQEAEIRRQVLQGLADVTEVVVARRTLPVGAVISGSTVAVAELPAAHVPPRAVTPSEFAKAKGKVLERRLATGEILQFDFLAGTVVERFSGLLEPGERAVSLQVSSLQTYAGMLLPGDYVDLYVMLSPEDDDKKPRLVPVLRRVKVLAAGAQPLRTADQDFQRLGKGGARYNMITVGVDRKQAEHLLLARQVGEIAFLLRSPEDKSTGLADPSLALFGARATSKNGYWYISTNVPEGELRAPGQSTETDSTVAQVPPATYSSGSGKTAAAWSTRRPTANGLGGLSAIVSGGDSKAFNAGSG